MTRTKLYTAIYVVLFVFATAQALVESAGLLHDYYWAAFGLIMVLSFVKAVFVAGYYQHLRWEPRAVTYLVLGGLFVALALTAAAAYSIL
ncbi:MAG: cytochrome C oxidase subunit IV family protein [Haloarculaceae archaeon]